MDRPRALARDVDRAIAQLDEVLAACPPPTAGLRCGRDSRTVSAVANHVADWLQVLAESVPIQIGAEMSQFHGEVADELDAALAKSAANRSLEEARLSLRRSRERLDVVLGALQEGDIEATVQSGDRAVDVGTFIRRWGCDHVVEHAAAIRAALLARR